MATALGRGSLPLFTFKGIKVRLHWTFLALPAYIIFSDLSEGQPWSAIGTELVMVAIVFMCVVLHEFGHALTAKRYGVGTRDITLLPIGGVASLERMPEEPRQEFWITLAGPLVNVAIAVIALVVMAILGLTSLVTDLLLGGAGWTSMLAFLFAVNVGLFLFNLIPAFPMDGGRLLRSLLAMRLGREKATRIATTLGRILAVLFAGYGIMAGQPFTVLIGVFVYMAAGAEARQVQRIELLRGVTVAQVMRTRFWSLQARSTVRQAVDDLLAGGDTAALVLDGSVPHGVVDRTMLMAAVEAGRMDSPISELPPRSVPMVRSTDNARVAADHMAEQSYVLLPVMEEDRLVGVIDLANVQEVLGLRKAMEASKRT
ncbi:MAG: site-2 protease family protein [Flavobacteriales bacterium]|nr:site-2 protease family protein [Flavobacteriales bacterium]